MKFPLLCLLLFSFHLTGYSQGIKPQNVYRVIVTNHYLLEDGERTERFYAVNQEIYDSLGRLHTEIDYDRETRYPSNYRWHYFDSLLLVRTEYYVNEKLELRRVFEYNTDTLVTRELHYRPEKEDTLLSMTLDFSLNEQGLPERIVATDSDGRRLYRIRSTFDDMGTEVRRRVTGRRGDPDDGIRRLDREAVYDSLGFLLSETVELRMAERTRMEYTRKYRYDERGNRIEMLELDDRGNQVCRIEYTWQRQRNRLGHISYYDENDQLQKFLAKRYEIYRTTDRRQRIIDY
ncbi:MAG: hypothetical protein R6U58_10750 [Bacteroidales bacterium]